MIGPVHYVVVSALLLVIGTAGILTRRNLVVLLMSVELVLNAVKHGKGRVTVRLVEEGEYLRFRVADEGPGFAPDFDPQRSAHTGLELVMTLARHDLGGEIVFENGSTGGAQVTVTFSRQAQTSCFF